MRLKSKIVVRQGFVRCCDDCRRGSWRQLSWCCKRRSAVNLCPSYLRRCSKCGVATIFTLVIKAVQSTWR
uniref:Uncharacterized protein n=1 Tax=Physcomitrium patens TaxID=3218 RepID=A0A2K1JKZ7_PHYPA|nr:hypothetical protein PHYPA_017026 [Physcomitrium patens]